MAVESFGPQNLAGTVHLLNLCSRSRRARAPAIFFSSSVSAVARQRPRPCRPLDIDTDSGNAKKEVTAEGAMEVEERVSEDPEDAQEM